MAVSKEREALRHQCTGGCPRGIVTDRDERWESPDGKGHKDLKDYAVYCLCDVNGVSYPQYIGRKYEWTGLIPKWCPRLKEARKEE